MGSRSYPPSYKVGPPDLSHIIIEERGLSFWPGLRPFDERRERLNLHHEMQRKEDCHRYATVLYCFCGECAQS